MRLLINSADRDTSIYTTPSSFRLNIGGGAFRVSKVRLRNYSIWDSSYVVNSNNNTFTFNDGSSYTVTLTQGNYTGSTLATELQTQLNAAASATTFTVTFNTTTNKFTIVSSVSCTYSFGNYTLAGRLLGFTSNVSGTTVTSSQVAMISTTSFYYIVLKNLPVIGRQNKPYTFIVLNNVRNGALLTNKEILNDCVESTQTDISYLDIEIRDMNYNLVELNGANWQLEIDLL